MRQLRINDQDHEASVYETAPNLTSKGVIRGIPLEDDPKTIDEKIVNSRNPTALAAKRIGKSTTIIIAFDGLKVPTLVHIGNGLFVCASKWTWVEFRKRLVQCLLINIRLKLDTQVNIRQAAEMLTWSWRNVKASTISNCWRRAGILKASPTSQDCEDTQELHPKVWADLTEKLPVDTAVTFDDYIDSESAAATSAELTNEDVVNKVLEQEDCSSDEEDADTESTHEEEESVSSSDILVFPEKKQSFLGRCKDFPDDVQTKVENVQAFVLQRLLSTQQKVTDFFKQ
ncbi:hypothetical protein HPB49_003370 [Dermacentor silvarum]|uniref:Uncharacterized protein n=1 Tax=Dermacentor silvarum TaxID=543639 RepID=A0ACB8DTT5_DERSI|nr:hypothetical protein HPB49_003370 [Dermacentor silvarum]